MDKSFQEILNEKLEGERHELPKATPVEPASSTAQNWSEIAFSDVNFTRKTTKPSFSVASYKTAPQTRVHSVTDSNTHPPKGAFGPAQAPAQPVPPTRPEEPVFTLRELKSKHREQAEVLIQLGATELKEGVSMKKLKRAHRRLARKFHPDAAAKTMQGLANHENFLKVQAAFKALERALPEYQSLSNAA